jgi:hypothetical protein
MPNYRPYIVDVGRKKPIVACFTRFLTFSSTFIHFSDLPY